MTETNTNNQNLLLKINANDTNPENQQDILENLSRGLGVEQYRKNVQSAVKGGRESTTSYGQTLMMNYVSTVAAGIKAVIDTKGSKGRGNLAIKYFDTMEPEALAFIALRAVLDSITKKDSLTNVAHKIGRVVELEIQTRVLKEKYSEEFKYAKERLKKATTAKHRRALVGAVYNRAEVTRDGIDQETAIKIGVKLIDIIVNATGLVEIKRTIRRKKHQNHLVPTEHLSEWIQDKNAHCELLTPAYLPCVIPPVAWTSPSKGGYHSKFHKGVPLVKVKGETREYRRMLKHTEMPKVYQAINTLQNTKWMVNPDVYAVMSECFSKGLDIGDALPPVEDHSELECKACGELVALSGTNRRNTASSHKCFEEKKEDGKDTEITRDWKIRAAKKHEANIVIRSKRLSVSKVLWVAGILKDFSEIYFPYQMDFRGRVYAIPNHLNPQGADYAKGLLTFAEGKPIEDALAGSWLAIQGANTYGHDKVSLSDRVSFIGGMEAEIRAVVSDPIGHKGIWTAADKPWQFLAFCFEWVGYLDAEANGECFVSHLPIAMDGSCSGIQHFSAMLRDEEGGKAVNLIPAETPQDIYQDVCDKVMLRFKLDAKGYVGGRLDAEDPDIVEPNKYAEWLLKLPLDRSMTKRQVMTVPYGLTARSCTDYTAQYFNELLHSLRSEDANYNYPWPKEEHWKVMQYASMCIWEKIGDTVVGAKDAMKWLQDVVSIVCKEQDVPVVWNTPMGLPIMQSYRKYDTRRVMLRLEGRTIEFKKKSNLSHGILTKRMKSGIAPNFVHSMDASHLVLMVCDAEDSHNITDFAVVHDSFGTHAANSEQLASSIRDTFVNMYEETDVLASFLSDMQEIVGDTEVEFPEIPHGGKLELAEVRRSQYFFA